MRGHKLRPHDCHASARMDFCWDSPETSLRPVFVLSFTFVYAVLIDQVSMSNASLRRCCPSSPRIFLQALWAARSSGGWACGSPRPLYRMYPLGKKKQKPGSRSRELKSEKIPAPFRNNSLRNISSIRRPFFYSGFLFPTEHPGTRITSEAQGAPSPGCKTRFLSCP